MLRLTGVSGALCVICSALGPGKVVPLAAGTEDLFLVVAALSATVLFGSSDAYGTEASAWSDRDE